MAKDFNDLLTEQRVISSLHVVDVDLFVADQILKQYADDQQGAMKSIEKFSKTISNPLVKSDLAKLLSQRWEKDLTDVKEFLKIAGTSSADEILAEFKDVYRCIEEMESSVLNFEGLTTGYPYFDHAIGGLSLTDVFFIAARPSVGKSFVAMEIALHMAIRLKLNIVFFSLE